ncbi:MAG: hypothetical protein ACKOL0_09595 [Solirubrobacterales bacterium]
MNLKTTVVTVLVLGLLGFLAWGLADSPSTRTVTTVVFRFIHDRV